MNDHFCFCIFFVSQESVSQEFQQNLSIYLYAFKVIQFFFRLLIYYVLTGLYEATLDTFTMFPFDRIKCGTASLVNATTLFKLVFIT